MMKILFYYFTTFIIMLFSFEVSAQNYPLYFDVTTLDGTNGFVIPRLHTGGTFGAEVRFIGDINNDGLEDIAIGNESELVGEMTLAGRAYIIFGREGGFPASFNLESLDGTNGFIVEAKQKDERRGAFIAGPGDINGDGIDDLIIGSSQRNDMVIYGATTFPPVITIDDINGDNGFVINVSGSNQVDALGDVNGDGINDFIIAVPHISGVTWVVYGRSDNFPSSIDVNWLDGENGFRTSSFPSSRASFTVGGAGDINNDGFNDLLIGSWNNSGNVLQQNSYALFGRSNFDPFVDITAVDGTDGFYIDNRGNNFLTYVGSLGDINGDGIDDFFSENNIIFGSENAFPDSLFMSDLDGTNGFVLKGNNILCASPIGDFNLDGIDDFIVRSNDNYVIFGKRDGFPPIFDPAILDGTNGFYIKDVSNTNSGRPVAGGGDINGDGISDFMFGNSQGTGNVFVVFGGRRAADQILTLATWPPDLTYGSGELVLSANASSGLPVTITSSNPDVATVSGNVVTFTGVGSTTIIVTQEGNDDFLPAQPIERTMRVNKGRQTIDFDRIDIKMVGDDDFELFATASSGLVPVTFTSSDTSVATISGNIVTIHGVGSATITASQAGNEYYNEATTTQRILTVNKGYQTITFEPLEGKYIGDEDFSLTAFATSGLPISFLSSDPEVASVSGDIVTINGVGQTIITALQTGNTNYFAAEEVQQVLKVSNITSFWGVQGINDFKLYPNPTTGLMHINSSGGHLENTMLKISNLQGEIVQTNIIPGGTDNFSLDISNLSSGIYFVEYLIGGELTRQKIIKL